MQYRHRAQRRQSTEPEHGTTTANLVGQRTEQRLHQHIDQQRAGHDAARGLRRHSGGIDQVLLHIRGEGIKNQRTARGKTDHRQERAFDADKLFFLELMHDAADGLA